MASSELSVLTKATKPAKENWVRRKDVMKKGTPWLLTAALLVGLLPIAGTPTTVQAETGETTETLQDLVQA